jgi:hypothetical protein
MKLFNRAINLLYQIKIVLKMSKLVFLIKLKIFDSKNSYSPCLTLKAFKN